MGNGEIKWTTSSAISALSKWTNDVLNNISNNYENINQIMTKQLNESIQNIVSKNSTTDVVDWNLTQKLKILDMEINNSSGATQTVSQDMKAKITLKSIWQVITSLDFKDELKKDMTANFAQGGWAKAAIDANLDAMQKSLNKFEQEQAAPFWFNPADIAKSLGNTLWDVTTALAGGKKTTSDSKSVKFENITNNSIKNITSNVMKNNNTYSDEIKNVINKNINIENTKKCLTQAMAAQALEIGNMKINNSTNAAQSISQLMNISIAIECMNMASMTSDIANALITSANLTNTQTASTEWTNKVIAKTAADVLNDLK